MSEELKEQTVEASTETTSENEASVVTSEESMAQFFDPNAPIVTLRRLLENGVHFGHATRKWNPKMKPYIFTARNNIYIIDLAKTAECIEKAYNALKEIVLQNGKVLFVGTKPQIAPIIKEEAESSGSLYVNNRWLGGTLTNFKVFLDRIKYLMQLEEDEQSGKFTTKTKKEAALKHKEMEKLKKNLDGIKQMRKLPNAIVVVDPTVEKNAIREAKKIGIPVFAIVDTNSDPDNIDYVIPGNDDAVKSVKLLVQLLADAVREGKGATPEAAHLKDEEQDITMKDAVKIVEKENAARLAAIREQKRLRKEAYEKQLAERENAAKKETTNPVEKKTSKKTKTIKAKTEENTENVEAEVVSESKTEE